MIRNALARVTRSALLLALAGSSLAGCGAPCLAIVDVAVIPMDSQRVLPSQTV